MGRDYLSGAGGPSSAAAALAGGGGGGEPLLGGGAFYTSVLAPRAARSPKDRGATVAYFVVLAVALAGGIYAAVHHNPDFAHGLDPAYLGDPSHCPARPPSAHAGRALLGLFGQDDAGPDAPPPPPPSPAPPPALSPKFFVAALSAYVGVSVVGGVLLGVGSMALYRAKPHAAVSFAIALQVGLPLAGGLAVLSSGAPLAAASPLLLTAALVAFVYYLYRAQLGLVAQLLGTAAQAVSHVWGVVVAAAGLQLAAALVSLPLAAFLFFAYANGQVVRSPLVASVAAGGGAGGADPSAPAQCLTQAGDPTLCCLWQPEGWAAGVMAVCALALAWTSLLAFCLKTYTVSGAVAAWYFAPASTSGDLASASGTCEGATKTALLNAVGPSFGTNALAALVLAAIGWARSALQQLRQQARDSFLAQVLLSCVDVVYAVLEQLSKFGVVFAAITGDAFFDAARRSTALLSRNLLDTVAVWVFPANVVALTNFALAGVWAWLAGASSYALVFAPAAARAAPAAPADPSGGAAPPPGVSAAALGAVAVGAVAFFFGIAAMSFLASVLLSAVDAVYLCFAIDRDRAQVTREEVHAVMVLLPAANKERGPGGGIVENPGGGLAFGQTATAV